MGANFPQHMSGEIVQKVALRIGSCGTPTVPRASGDPPPDRSILPGAGYSTQNKNSRDIVPAVPKICAEAYAFAGASAFRRAFRRLL
jgi:hypothetical protein